jgi:hypothetical protein
LSRFFLHLPIAIGMHTIVFDGLLLERIGAPLLPLAGVGVVAALEGLEKDFF